MPRYTSFPAHRGSSVRQLLSNEQGVYSLSTTNVRLSNRRGFQTWNKLMPGAACMGFSGTTSELLVASAPPAGGEPVLSVLNLFRGSVVKEITVDQSIVAMKRGRLLVHATASGQVLLRDPKTMRAEHTIQAHAGGIADIDIIGSTLVTCGFFVRNGSPMVDPLVKIYDMRMMRPLAPIPFAAGASFVRFNPRIPTLVFSFAQSGKMQICDIMSPNYTSVTFLRAEVPGLLTGVDVSSSGEAFALADSASGISVWSNRQSFFFNQYSRPSDYCDMFTDKPTVQIFDATPLSAIGMPHYSAALLSMWPSDLFANVGRQPPRIPPEILKNVKMNDFVGYVQNTSLKRNQNLVLATRGGREQPKFRSQQQREKQRKSSVSLGQKQKPAHYPGIKAAAAASAAAAAATPGRVELGQGIPAFWRRVEIRYSKFGIEDFDFAFFNGTPYGGLETDIQNSYLNSLLQSLFFLRPLRELVKAHIRTNCARDPCLSCELGFLFRMLEDSKGVNCQASNFLRAFASVQQANALGVVETENSNPADTQSYSVLIQTVNRFLLEQIHQELGARAASTTTSTPSHEEGLADEYIKMLFGIPLETVTTCAMRHEQSRAATPFTPSTGFHALLQSSFHRESSTRAWCDQCQNYHQSTQSRRLKGLPTLLSINANATTDADLDVWISEDMNTFLPRSGDEYVVVDLEDPKIEIDLSSPDVAVYDLRAVVSEVVPDDEAPHLVSCINVSEDTQNPSWFIFNDFLVQEITHGEELQFEEWKIILRGLESTCVWDAEIVRIGQTPAIIQYVRRRHELDKHFNLPSVEPDYSILVEDQKINQREDLLIRYQLFTPDEVPRTPGYICAIDTEFVAMSHGEAEIRSDGTKSTIRPPQYGLARVSVVRGSDETTAIPFIDDYIHIAGPIADYVTEFSGIKPGDLDVRTSQMPLVSLKVAYKKLRLLVDLGCVFVGHGLKGDCRTINILIPPHQIIDTVEIFHIKKHGRHAALLCCVLRAKLSLRFLVWFFFKEDIQLESHDSIEDARAALRIYRKYLEAMDNGTFEKLLEDIYEEGRVYNFRPPNAAMHMQQQAQQALQRQAHQRAGSHTRAPSSELL
nr:poly(A)-specific ribonuclease [Polyrhizophydium stewartii]